MRQDDAKQVNVTMSAEEKDKLLEYCKETGTSINAAMNKARDLLLVDGLKYKAPDQAADIDDFELTIAKLLTLYRTAIDRSINARAAAEIDVRGELNAMSSLVDTANRLQADKDALQEKVDLQSKQIADLTRTIDECKKQYDISEAKSKEVSKQCAESERTIARLQEDINRLKAENADILMRHTQEIAELQNDNFEKILKIIQAK